MADLNSTISAAKRFGPRKRTWNYDNMVVKPFSFPPDKNTFDPDDISSYIAVGKQFQQEDI